MPEQTNRFTIMIHYTDYQYFAGQWFNCSKSDYFKIKDQMPKLECRVFRYNIVCGKKEISRKTYKTLHAREQEGYLEFEQCKIMGVWREVYHTNSEFALIFRKVYREK